MLRRAWLLAPALLAALLLVPTVDAKPRPHPTTTTTTTTPAGCTTDSTATLRDQIAATPDGGTLTLAPGGCYLANDTIEITNRHDLTIDGNGAIIRSTTTGDPQRAHLRWIGGTNLAVRNLTIIGSNTACGGLACAYNDALQYQHGLDLRGVTGWTATNVTIDYVYGDCVYVGLGYDAATWSTDVTVSAATCRRNGRMGVAVVAGQRVTVADSTLDLVGLSSLICEPNGGVTGCLTLEFVRNTIGRSRHWPVAVVGYSGGGAISGVVVRDNTIRNRSMAVKIERAQGPRPSGIQVINNSGDVAEWFGGSAGVVDVIEADAVTVTGNAQPLVAGQYFVYARASCVDVGSNVVAGGAGELLDESPSC